MILMVHSYGGANHDVATIFPYWKRTGQFSRMIGVATEGEHCVFPAGMEHVTIGKPGYMVGDNLCRRIIDCATWALGQPGWEWLCQMEYDTVLFRPFPPLPVGLSGHLAGGKLPGCKGSFFLHGPWVADRATWSRIALEGLQMLADGDTENNSPDCFISWVCEKSNIPVNMAAFKSASRNTVHGPIGQNGRPQPDFIPEMRAAYQDHVVSIHGVKSSKLYNTDALEVLRQITRP